METPALYHGHRLTTALLLKRNAAHLLHGHNAEQRRLLTTALLACIVQNLGHRSSWYVCKDSHRSCCIR